MFGVCVWRPFSLDAVPDLFSFVWSSCVPFVLCLAVPSLFRLILASSPVGVPVPVYFSCVLLFLFFFSNIFILVPPILK
jgi:hypothetical protein